MKLDKNKAEAGKLVDQLYKALTSKMEKLNEEDKLTNSHITGKINNISDKIRDYGTSVLLMNPTTPIDGFNNAYKVILKEIEEL